MSIRYKIFFLLTLGAVAILGAIASVYFYYSQAAIKKEMMKHLDAMANVQYERVSEVIDHSYEMLRLISSRTQLRVLLNAYQEDGAPETFAQVKKIMGDALKGSHYIDDLFLIDTDGRVMGCMSGKWRGKSFADDPLFLSGRERSSVSLVQSGGNRPPSILFSAPLLLEGNFIGVIAMQVNMDYFQKVLSDYTGLGRTGEVLMAIENGGGELLFFTPLRFGRSPVLVDRNSPNAVPMQNALMQRELVFDDVPDYRGEQVIAYTRYFRDLGIGIVVKIDKAELLATQEAMGRFILYALLVMVLIAGAAAIILSRMITQPVIDITQSAMRISDGAFRHRARDLGKNELGQLARALNLMADRLIEANANLELRVKEKTFDLQIANEKLEQMAQIDGLTGIANRRKFDDHLHEEWQRCMRTQIPLSVIMIDIDFFKAVNDTMGHQKGDDYLQAIAAILKESVHRSGDLVARYGGEEFVVVLENTSAVFAETLAETIRKTVLERRLEHSASEVGPYVTVSAGVATHIPGRGEEPALLIEAADSALYRAKREGRNRVVNGNRHT